MPHLSPMIWILAPIMFLAVVFFFSSALWWYQMPSFPKSQLLSFKKQNSWNWA